MYLSSRTEIKKFLIYFILYIILTIFISCDNADKTNIPYQIYNHTGNAINVKTDFKRFNLDIEETSEMLYMKDVWEYFYINDVPFQITKLYIYQEGYSLYFTITQNDENYTCGTTYKPIL